MKHFSQAVCRLMSWIYKHRIYALSLALIIFAVSIPFYSYATDTETLLSNPFEFTFNAVLGILLALTNLVVSLVGKLIVLLLGAIIIPILGYNNFGNSTVVDIGWPLVRDIVNMFVIVILLVIAVQTIVGYGQSKWEQQLPKLFLAIVLVNFSRTICLLMVDASQVVMFTFVNALRDIAAGNFMSLFQLNEFVSVNADMTDIASAVSGATGASGAQGMSMTNLLMTSYATLSLLFMVLGTLIILTVVYLYRIVLIWVLMILSPIAFFMKGLEGIVSESGKYKEWMNMFVGALTLGPILTFFLWLGLAAASSGPIAVSEGMNFEGTSDVPTLLANAFATDKFVSVLIGMILIMAGFKVGSGAASAMGNIAGKLVTEDAGKKMFKGALTMPASYAYRGARGVGKGAMWAGKKAGVEVGRQFAGSETGKAFAKYGSDVLSGIGKSFIKDGGYLRTKIGGAFIGASGRFGAEMEAPNVAGREKAKERTAGESEDTAAAYLSSAFNADGSLKAGAGLADMRANEQRIIRAMTDKKFRKTLKGQMSADQYKQFMANAMAHVDKNKDDILDSAQAKEFDKTRNGNLTAWVESKRAQAAADGKPPLTDNDVQKILNEIISDDDFRVSQLSEEDMKNDDIIKALGDKTVRQWENPDGSVRTESMLDQVRAGRGVDAKVQNASKRPTVPPPAPPPPPDPEVVLASGATDQIADAIRNGLVDINNIESRHLADPVKAEEIARAIVASGKNVSGVTNAAVQNQINQALNRVASRSSLSVNERAKLNAERVRQGVPVENIVTINPTTGNISDADANMLRGMTQQNPDIILNLSPYINSTRPNNLTQAVARTYSKDQVDALITKFQSTTDAAEKSRIRGMVAQMQKAIQAESTRAAGDPNAVFDAKRVREMARHLNLAQRETR
jgi:hypothetical protein